MSLYEFAYSHIYCNQLKIAGNFKDKDVVNGYLQKCFNCCDTKNEFKLLKPGSRKPSQLMKVPLNQYENSALKVASKGIPGGMSDWDKINANEYNQLKMLYTNIYGDNYTKLYKHLNNVFNFFEKIEQSIGETAISIYKPKQFIPRLGIAQKPKITLSLEMIYFYNITKMAASLHNQYYYNLNKKLFDKKGNLQKSFKEFIQKKTTKKRKRESRGGTKNITRKNKKLVKKYLIEY